MHLFDTGLHLHITALLIKNFTEHFLKQKKSRKVIIKHL